MKEDFSFQWVISNCRKLQDWTATVRGPKIHSNKLPYRLSIYISFADSTITIRGEDKGKALKYSNVWVCNCSVTIPEQSSVKMPDQNLVYKTWSLPKKSCAQKNYC